MLALGATGCQQLWAAKPLTSAAYNLILSTHDAMVAVLAEQFSNPKRVRLPVPAPAHPASRDTVMTLLANLTGANDDVACLADLEDVSV